MNIAFFAANYNVDSAARMERTDHSLIEFALYFANPQGDEPVYLNLFVRPEHNNGKLYPSISENTGVTQEQVDSGISTKRALYEIADFIDEYNIEKVYAFGSYDNFALRWNSKNVPYCDKEVYDKLHIIEDCRGVFRNRLALDTDRISLNNVESLTVQRTGKTFERDGSLSRLAQKAELLSNLYDALMDPNAPDAREVRSALKIEAASSVISKLKQVIAVANKEGLNVPVLFDLAYNNKPLTPFDNITL